MLRRNEQGKLAQKEKERQVFEKMQETKVHVSKQLQEKEALREEAQKEFVRERDQVDAIINNSSLDAGGEGGMLLDELDEQLQEMPTLEAYPDHLVCCTRAAVVEQRQQADTTVALDTDVLRVQAYRIHDELRTTQLHNFIRSMLVLEKQ